MGTLVIHYHDNLVGTTSGRQQFIADDTETSRVVIGADLSCDLVLNSPRVAAQAIILYRVGAGWTFEVQRRAGHCTLNGARVTPGLPQPALTGATIHLPPFELNLLMFTGPPGASIANRPMDNLAMELLRDVHAQTVSRLKLGFRELSPHELENAMLRLEQDIDAIAVKHKLYTPELIDHLAAECLRSVILDDLFEQTNPDKGNSLRTDAPWRKLLGTIPEWEENLTFAVERTYEILGATNPNRAHVETLVTRLDREYLQIWESLRTQLHSEVDRYLSLRFLKKQIKDTVLGLGPLEDLLSIPGVNEIMCVGSRKIFIERQGGAPENSGRSFLSDETMEAIVDRLVTAGGGKISRSRPMADVRLRDGSRVNAVIPPVAVSGPTLTIRRFSTKFDTADDLVHRRKTLTPAALELLRAAVAMRMNIIISGGTGAGKTTLLNIVSAFISNSERIVSVEDVAELSLQKDHVVRLETLDANIENKGAIGFSDLIRNVMRMRADRVVLGECRDAAAADMLQAFNTGHDGSFTTIHANSAEEVIPRLVALVQMAGNLPVAAIHQQIAASVDMIVHIRRDENVRRVSQITEVLGVDHERGGVRTKDIFQISPETQRLEPTGLLPGMIDEMVAKKLLELDTFFPTS